MFCSLKNLNLVFLDSLNRCFYNNFDFKNLNLSHVNKLTFNFKFNFDLNSSWFIYNIKNLPYLKKKFIEKKNLSETDFSFFEQTLWFYSCCLNKSLKFNFFNILNDRKRVENKVLRSAQFYISFSDYLNFFYFSSFFFNFFIRRNNYNLINPLSICSNLGVYNLNYIFYLNKNLYLNSIWKYFRPHCILFFYFIHLRVLGYYTYFNALFISFFGFFSKLN